MSSRAKIPDNALPCEWWVMRVWTRWVDGRRYAVCYDDCSTAVQIAINAGIALGKLAILPGGIVAEPVEVFDGVEGQVGAHARRETEALAHPREDFRVVMNADV